MDQPNHAATGLPGALRDPASRTTTATNMTVAARNHLPSGESRTASSPPPAPTLLSIDVDAGKIAEPSTAIPCAGKVGPQNFEKIRILGVGSTGRVYLVRSVGLGEEQYYAMKVVKKSELVKRNRVQRILTERQILSVASHPFVVTLYYSFQTDDYFYLVMQYCAGGEFFSFLKRQERSRLTEEQTKFYAAEVLVALEYLHLIGIIYRDLKPENILVHESGHIMLSDFDLAFEQTNSPVSVSPVGSYMSATGLHVSARKSSVASVSASDRALWLRIAEYKPQGKPHPRRSSWCAPFSCITGARIAYPLMDTEAHLDNGEKRTSFVGTHEYVAPEIIAEEGYVGSVDWWAFGILLYEMVYATTPFRGTTQIQTLENILDISEDIEFPTDVTVSEEFKDLIRRLLAKNVTKRLQNPILIKTHPFFRSVRWQLIRHQKPPIVPPKVHALQERQYTAEEIDAFDNEVPFMRGAPSPNKSKRMHRTTSAGSDVGHVEGNTAVAGDTAVHATDAESTAHEHARRSRKSSSARTMAMSAYVSHSRAASSDHLHHGEHHSTTRSDGHAHDQPHGASPSHSRMAATDIELQAFDYSSNDKPKYWTSNESTRELMKKLSEMREASPEELHESS
ncbi:TPA: hypothetical protein N0F65_011328 [Lagenidium giganteum]|uniref:non-specific serine/threonine protein kinase n=1 Tax=Lagenidium giganteum TaxID=4803 RepID=A0AAV2YN51_9STRA|nr:TPA: hypothetical protein N0F65_011328 [Lagenidium giganteum]